MNIFEIDAAVLALVDPETGEILDDAAFDALQMEREEKVENVALWIKELAAEASAIREEELRLAERRRARERKADRLKEYLVHALQGSPYESPRCKVTFRRSTKVELTEPLWAVEWAEEHCPEIVSYKTPEVNKTALAKYLKSGEAVPGAMLAENVTIGVK